MGGLGWFGRRKSEYASDLADIVLATVYRKSYARESLRQVTVRHVV